MLRTFIIVAVSAAAFALASSGAFAQKGQFGTAAEARAMEERVITELKTSETAALAKGSSGNRRIGFAFRVKIEDSPKVRSSIACGDEPR